MIRTSRPRSESCCSSRDANVLTLIKPPEIPKQLVVVFSLSTFSVRVCARIKCTRTHARSFDVRLLCAQFVAIGSCSSLKQEEYERAFTDPFLTNFSSKTDFRFREKKNGFRVFKEIRTIKFLFSSYSTLCQSLVSPLKSVLLYSSVASEF
jgi:hypothetical protein